MPQLPKENVKLADQELNEVLARIGGRTHLSPTAARPHSSDDPDAIAPRYRRDLAHRGSAVAIAGFVRYNRHGVRGRCPCHRRHVDSVRGPRHRFIRIEARRPLPLETTLCTEVRQPRNPDSAGKPRTHLRALLSPLDIPEPAKASASGCTFARNRPRPCRPPRRRIDGGFRHALHRANSAARHARCGLIARTMAVAVANGSDDNGMTFASSGGRNARTGGR